MTADAEGLMSADDYPEQASFYRAALLLGLVRGDRVITWADAVLAVD